MSNANQLYSGLSILVITILLASCAQDCLIEDNVSTDTTICPCTTDTECMELCGGDGSPEPRR